MSAADRVESLRAALGVEAVSVHPPEQLDGTAIGVTLTPGDGEALALAVRTLASHGLAAVVRGGGSRLDLGNPPRRADVWLSTARLDEIIELDADEGVCQAGAGTPLQVLATAANEGGWELPLDPPGRRASVGGTLAAAAIGPRSLGLGLPRDVVLGLEVTLGSGERTRCGGRVVKNVTGYDLQKLYTGSLGTLCVIERAWLRLRPAPERAAIVCAQVQRADAAVSRGLEVARSPAARAVALVSSGLALEVAPHVKVPRDGFLLICELAGAASLVRREEDRILVELGGEQVPPEVLDRVRSAQGGVSAAGPGAEEAVRLRISARSSRLAAALEALTAVAAEVLVYPGQGLVWVRSQVAEPTALNRLLSAADEAVRIGGGDRRIEAAPLPVKQAHDVFSAPAEALALTAAIKARYDPRGVLAPGRFAGRV